MSFLSGRLHLSEMALRGIVEGPYQYQLEFRQIHHEWLMQLQLPSQEDVEAGDRCPSHSRWKDSRAMDSSRSAIRDETAGPDVMILLLEIRA